MCSRTFNSQFLGNKNTEPLVPEEDPDPKRKSFSAKATVICKITRRLGVSIEAVLDTRLQPRDGDLVPLGADEWGKHLLDAYDALVWHNVTMQEINAKLMQNVRAR